MRMHKVSKAGHWSATTQKHASHLHSCFAKGSLPGFGTFWYSCSQHNMGCLKTSFETLNLGITYHVWKWLWLRGNGQLHPYECSYSSWLRPACICPATLSGAFLHISSKLMWCSMTHKSFACKSNPSGCFGGLCVIRTNWLNPTEPSSCLQAHLIRLLPRFHSTFCSIEACHGATSQERMKTNH